MIAKPVFNKIERYVQFKSVFIDGQMPDLRGAQALVSDRRDGEAALDTARAATDLDVFLDDSVSPSLARVLQAIAGASSAVAYRIRRGALAGDIGADVGPAHDGVAQKALDVFAHEAFLNWMARAGVRAMLSEEHEEPIVLDPDGAWLVAIDPLDGSNNIDANGSMGTFFSVLDAPLEPFRSSHFLQPGGKQRAAGFVLYGPHVAFVFTCGAGVHMATLEPDANQFRVTGTATRIPLETREFAINASNSRHWPGPVRSYIQDCLDGEEGPRGGAFNMRWTGAVVAEVYRILVRGGVYLYPEDSRPGYERGRLRLLYEASPIAFLIEQAGGGAIDGFDRILDLTPTSLHARTPLIFGSKDKVERVERYYADDSDARIAPLFARRGLLRH
jgi:fructose-1,6-bisphosphatase I